VRRTPGLLHWVSLLLGVFLACGTPTGPTETSPLLYIVRWFGPAEDTFAPPLPIPPSTIDVATWGIRLRSTFIAPTRGSSTRDRARLIPSAPGTKHVDILREFCCDPPPQAWRVDYQVEVRLLPPGPLRFLWTHSTLRDGSETTEVVLDTTITVP